MIDLYGRFLCWITRKHQRAKKGTAVVGSGKITTECPRCHRKVTRTIRNKAKAT